MGSLAFGQKTDATPVLGGDKDAHGCKASAGYTFSYIKNDCVRTFEQKVQLKEQNPKGSYTTNAAVIFSKDMKKAEVFCSGKRFRSNSEQSWKESCMEKR